MHRNVVYDKQDIRLKVTLHETSHHCRNQILDKNCKKHGIQTMHTLWTFKQLFDARNLYTNNWLHQQQRWQKSVKPSIFCQSILPECVITCLCVIWNQYIKVFNKKLSICCLFNFYRPKYHGAFVSTIIIPLSILRKNMNNKVL